MSEKLKQGSVSQHANLTQPNKVSSESYSNLHNNKSVLKGKTYGIYSTPEPLRLPIGNGKPMSAKEFYEKMIGRVVRGNVPSSQSEVVTVKTLMKEENVPMGKDEEKRKRNYEKFVELQKFISDAIKDHKVFMINGFIHDQVRRSLIKRGWVEKVRRNGNAKEPDNDDNNPSNADSAVEHLNESKLLRKMLEGVKPDLLWTGRGVLTGTNVISENQMVNRLTRASFTTKVGLCDILENVHWYIVPGVAYVNFPRCYKVNDPDGRQAFTDDYRITACISLLAWFRDHYASGKDSAVSSRNGSVPFSALTFAANRCKRFMDNCEHEDIDAIQANTSITEAVWEAFLSLYYRVIHEGDLFLHKRNQCIKKFYRTAKTVLTQMSKYWPQMPLDGVRNIWIVKPGCRSRGLGISMMCKYQEIMNKVTQGGNDVVQKYIEKPMLIHDTKFDIRQWFLVTSTEPLELWMYREAYVRFCSQKFTFKSFHESIHLCNNAVQYKYKNDPDRSPELPAKNMWDRKEFQHYLTSLGHENKWEEVVYPGMKANLVAVMLSAQVHTERRKNSFELFGADFMITEDFTPWLIEVNSTPCMAATTPVTARLCTSCIEDMIKVVIDYRNDPTSSTGCFECVYKEVLPRNFWWNPLEYFESEMDLKVCGCEMVLHPYSERSQKSLCQGTEYIKLVSGVKRQSRKLKKQNAQMEVLDALDNVETNKAGVKKRRKTVPLVNKKGRKLNPVRT